MIYRLESTNTRFRHRLRKHLDNYPGTYKYTGGFFFLILFDCTEIIVSFLDLLLTILNKPSLGS